MKQIVLASGNQGKLREFKHLLSAMDFEVLPQSHFDIDSVPETGTTFVENAIIKARHASALSGLPAIADDSGIEIDALNGAPGIYSARFSGDDANDARNNQLLMEKLKGLPKEQRGARYQCILVLMRHKDDPTPLICQASWEGTILEEEIGENGFGYDPLFFVEEFNCSSAQLDKDTKNKISHRGKAMRLLLDEMKNLGL